MDDNAAFERMIANATELAVGPPRTVDVSAIVGATTSPASSSPWPVITQRLRATSPPPTWRLQSIFRATKFLVAGAIVALFGGFLLAAVLTQPSDDQVPAAVTDSPAPTPPEAGTFSSAGSLAKPRNYHTATLLPDGRVLVVGGCCIVDGDDVSAIEAAEVYDPATATFSPAGSLVAARRGQTATRLPDGRVLVVGGSSGSATGWEGSATAEVWDPATAAFEPVGALAEARQNHTATALLDGRVLIVGGWGPDGLIGSAEVYDPTTATFSAAGSLIEARGWHTATSLSDGRVLIAGGTSTEEWNDAHASAEVWDPATASFEPAGSMVVARLAHTATLLSDGRVLLVGGGVGGGSSDIRRSAEIWDPATGTFSPTGSLAESRAEHTATLLSDGRVLVIGDGHQLRPDPSAEVWDPATATFSPAGSLARGRQARTATLLLDGRVLVVGGFVGGDRGNHTTGSAEVWESSDG